jgi:hypothetical protein
MGTLQSNRSKTSALCSLLIALLFSCESGLDNNSNNSSLPLSGPQSVQLTARDGAIIAQWTKVASAQGVMPSYEVYCGTGANPAAAWKSADVTASDSNLVLSTIGGLSNHAVYYVWVKAVFAGLGVSGFSPTEYAMPVPPPVTPGTLRTTSGEGMIELDWDSVPDAFTYRVYCRSGSGGAEPSEGTLALEVADSETKSGAVIFKLADDTPLTNGTSYTVWVQAANTAGESGYAQTTGMPLTASSPPSASPLLNELVSGAKKLSAGWEQVSAVPSYKIYYSTENNFDTADEFASLIPASSPLVGADITGLANGINYYIWAQSWNSQSTKANSPRSAVKTGRPEAKAPVNYNDLQFVLGRAASDFIFSVDLPVSVWYFYGRANTDRITRFQEAAIGNLYTDGAAWYVRNNHPADTFDFVFLNGSLVNNAIPKGTVKIGGLMNATLPDGRADKLCLITMRGDKLQEFFNDVADVTHTGHGSANTGWFGMVSKEAAYTVQYYRPPELSGWSSPEEINRGNSEPYYHGRIKAGTLKINGEAVNPSQNYRILTTDYLTKGEYYTVLYLNGTNKKVLPVPVWKAVAEYIYDQGAITPKLDGRIKIEGGVPLPPPWVPGNWINDNPPAW